MELQKSQFPPAITTQPPDTVEPPLRNSRAFTLVELIVVVLMLGVLMVWMFPALARSSDNGARAICGNNLRQLGSALLMYGADNNDAMAYPNWGTVLPGWLFSATGSVIPDPTAAPYVTNLAAAYRSGLWFSYVQNPRSYLCPVDPESRYYTGRANKLSSYVMNGAVCGFGSSMRTARLTEIWSPRCYLLWHPDENMGSPPIGAFAFNDASSFPDRNEGPGCRHTLNGTDLLTVGGSVEFVALSKFRMAQTNTGLSFAWWSPFSAGGH